MIYIGVDLKILMFNQNNCMCCSAVTSTGDVRKGERSPADAFLEALDSLSRSRIDLLEQGIDKAKHRLTLIMNQVRDKISIFLNFSGDSSRQSSIYNSGS